MSSPDNNKTVEQQPSRLGVRATVEAFGSLLMFAGPVAPYPVAQADDIAAKAWEQTGRAIHHAIDEIDAEAAARRK